MSHTCMIVPAGVRPGEDVIVMTSQGELAVTPYMQGAAYLVGNRLAAFVVRQPFAELVSLRWEDASVGLWLNAMAGRQTVRLPSADESKFHCVCSPGSMVYHRCSDRRQLEKVCCAR